MAKEMIYTGKTLLVDSDGSQWPMGEEPEGAKGLVCVRGFEVNFSRDRDAVELGIGLIDSSGSMGFEESQSHFVQLDREEMARLIKVLQRAARVTFGTNPW